MYTPDFGASHVEARMLHISEVAERFSISLRAIRFYEEKGIVRPQRTGPHTRVYGPADVERIGFAVACRGIGICIEAIVALITLRDQKGEDAFRANLIETLAERAEQIGEELSEIEASRRRVDTWLDSLRGARDPA